VAQLGKEMYQAHVTDGAKNRDISTDDYTRELKKAREEAIKALAALHANSTAATVRDAQLKKTALERAVAEVERRYTLYRNIPYEADAHEVGDAEQQAIEGWP
jgi:hypothetical protein